MNRTDAERITEEYLRALYGFALKRCRTPEDAEDLTQEIAAKLFSALTMKNDIVNLPAFIWRLAHNQLANYYRDRSASYIGVPVEDYADTLASDDDVEGDILRRETQSRLHDEIARLSRLQRQIVVAYYYRNKRQREIADELGIPEGTVKWHLFEAKKELRKGMEEMRNNGELKFNPIKLCMISTNGSPGSKGSNQNFLRSALAQNIAYCVRDQWKTVNEIADEMGTSPVYVESEAEFLTEYGFLLKDKDKYIINFLINEPSEELLLLQHEIYKKAAEAFAPRLFDALKTSDAVKSDDIICRGDENYTMWSLFAYAAALSGEKTADHSISFEEAMTHRPDGGFNICSADVYDPDLKMPEVAYLMNDWCGPMWSSNGTYTLWQINSRWSSRLTGDSYPMEADRAIALMQRILRGGELTEDEYAFLTEKGYLARGGNKAENITAVVIKTADAARRIVAVGDEIKDAMRGELEVLKAPYVDAVLADTPKHLRKMQAFGLQYMFESDGMFLVYCLHTLVESGRLTEPNEEERRGVMTLLIAEK